MVSAFVLSLVLSQGEVTILDRLKAEAVALGPFVETPLAKSFLNAVPSLPNPGKRTVFQDTTSKKFFADQSADGARKVMDLDEKFYFDTKYGTPLAYARAIELLGKAGLSSFRGKKVLDFGYGGIGPLRLIAENGGTAVGLDVDSLLKALYSKPSDTGRINGRGRIELVEGFFPTDPLTVKQLGSGYDVFLSKNTLKRGYVHPDKEVDKRLLVDLGVSDLEFCQEMAKLLKPGGLFLIYNLSPAQNPPDMPYVPWADGRCPFPKAELERAGFEVLAYDVIDDKKAREMGSLIGWDKGPSPMNFEKDLFAHYTLARKK